MEEINRFIFIQKGLDSGFLWGSWQKLLLNCAYDFVDFDIEEFLKKFKIRLMV
jgi:hypothetical protein